MPKSYLTDEARQEFGDLPESSLLAEEMIAAQRAGDEETADEWFKLVPVPATILKTLKRTHGADWIRQKGLRTEEAEKIYGANWLDK